MKQESKRFQIILTSSDLLPIVVPSNGLLPTIVNLLISVCVHKALTLLGGLEAFSIRGNPFLLFQVDVSDDRGSVWALVCLMVESATINNHATRCCVDWYQPCLREAEYQKKISSPLQPHFFVY